MDTEMLHLARKSVLASSEMSALDDFLAALNARRERLKSELDAISEAIKKIEEGIRVLPPDALEKIAAGLPDITTVQSGPSLPQRMRGPLPPQEIALAAKSALLTVGRPLKRGALVAELKRRGVPLAGANANKNLGTIIWRHPNMFVSLNRLGYWVKGVPLPGIYDPDE